MVKFLHMADVHLGINQYNLKERFRDFGRAFKDAVKFGLRNDVDFFLIAGDLFEKKNINPDTLIQVESAMSPAVREGVPIFVCEGNHDATYYGNMWSWLEYLSHSGVIYFLTPEKTSSGPELVPWNEEKRMGSYFEGEFSGERVRIYGFGYLGASTKKNVEIFAEKIIRDEAINIAMLHTGVEGIITYVAGTVTSDSLAILKNKVDYLALGHIHKHYRIPSQGSWIFNPGSLENWSADETHYEHGLYLVNIERNGSSVPEVKAEFIDWKEHRRPFYFWEIDVAGCTSEKEILERVREFLAENESRVAGKQVVDKVSFTMNQQGNRGITLDTFVMKDPQRKPYGNMRLDDAHGKNTRQPVVIARLRGKVETEMPIDVELVRDLISTSLNPSPLYVDVRDESSKDEFYVDGAENLSRKEMELQVIRDRVEQGDYSQFVDEVTTLIYQIKEGFSRKVPIEDFVEAIRAVASEMVKKRRLETAMITGFQEGKKG